jgi:hypothetical protein
MFDIIIIIIRFAPAERDDIYFLTKKWKKCLNSIQLWRMKLNI